MIEWIFHSRGEKSQQKKYFMSILDNYEIVVISKSIKQAFQLYQTFKYLNIWIAQYLKIIPDSHRVAFVEKCHNLCITMPKLISVFFPGFTSAYLWQYLTLISDSHHSLHAKRVVSFLKIKPISQIC